MDTSLPAACITASPDWPGVELLSLHSSASPLAEAVCASFATLCRLFQQELAALGAPLSSFQAFDAEMSTLPGRYAAAQRGGLWLALVPQLHNGRDLSGSPALAGLPLLHLGCRGPASVVGCLALRDLGQGSGELKRMFVAPGFRGRGVGRLLLQAAVAAAAALGCQRLLLDTLGRLQRANALYTRAGFVATAPYCENPLPDAIFLQLPLGTGAPAPTAPLQDTEESNK
jgi:putative acetyltransferase